MCSYSLAYYLFHRIILNNFDDDDDDDDEDVNDDYVDLMFIQNPQKSN